MKSLLNQKVVSYNYIDEEYSNRWNMILGRDEPGQAKPKLFEGNKDHDPNLQVITEDGNSRQCI